MINIKEMSLYQNQNGSLISLDMGMATGHAIDRLQDRGRFYIDPGEQVYRGQVIGEIQDLEILKLIL